MKTYKETTIITKHFYDLFNDLLNTRINEYQQKGYQVEIHYSTNLEKHYEILYSALILAYMEE